MRSWVQKPLGKALVGIAVLATAGAIIIPATNQGGSSLPPLGQPSCVSGAVNVTTASAVVSNLAAGNNVCVTARITADVLVQNQFSTNIEYLGTTGSGQIDLLDLNDADYLNVRVRARRIRVRGDSDFVTVEQSKLGGTGPTDREFGEQGIVNMIDTSFGTQDVTLQDNEIGYSGVVCCTGNSGYGIRAYADNDRLTIRRNWIHDIAADGIQGVGGVNVVIDRNEIGPVGDNPTQPDPEHSDNIQITSNQIGLEITNNWIHHQGYFDPGTGLAPTNNSGVTYIHGDSASPSNNTVLYENNLVQTGQGRVEIGGLGTGGSCRSNMTIRSNTFYDLGLFASSFPGFEWDISCGSGNVIERNVAADPDGGGLPASSDSTVTVANNIKGALSVVTLDGDGNCTSANCTGSPAIGYRKPSGVHW